MRKYITNCVEFETGNEHIITLISKKPIPKKQSVISYLKSGKDDGVCCASVHDYIADTYTGDTIHRYTDGEFFWDDEEIYHFEKYNIELNKDFLNSIIA